MHVRLISHPESTLYAIGNTSTVIRTDSYMNYSVAHHHERLNPPKEPALQEPVSKPVAGFLLGSALGIVCWGTLFILLALFWCIHHTGINQYQVFFWLLATGLTTLWRVCTYSLTLVTQNVGSRWNTVIVCQRMSTNVVLRPILLKSSVFEQW